MADLWHRQQQGWHTFFRMMFTGNSHRIPVSAALARNCQPDQRHNADIARDLTVFHVPKQGQTGKAVRPQTEGDS